MIHITGTGVNNLPACAGVRVTINTGLTGTITITDGAGIVQAIITNPVTGNTFTYYGMVSVGQNGGTLVASAIGDITVSILSRTMA